MNPVASGLQPGMVLAGKYRVDRVLGAGAMGVVVQAHHLALDTRVAIKLLLPGMLTNQDAVTRFAREARAVARLTNEHVTRVFDVGTLDTGAPYMVMEFLEGSDMHKWLQERGPLPVEAAVDLVLQVCDAVRDAHERGIVHRDLKPANLFCVRRSEGRPFVKVLDFGISKFVSAGEEGSLVSMTRTGALMGTPLYMAPEQMGSSRDVDARADIWALGCILFELLTRRVPFFGESLPEVCLKVTTEPAPSVRQARPDVPDAIEAAIFRCLEKDRNRRFERVADLQAAIAPFAVGPASGWNPLHYAPRSSETVAAETPLMDSRLGQSGGTGRSLGPVGNTKSAESRGPGRGLVVAGAVAAGGLAIAAAVGLTIAANRTAFPKAATAETSAASPASASVTSSAASAVPALSATVPNLPPLVVAPPEPANPVAAGNPVDPASSPVDAGAAKPAAAAPAVPDRSPPGARPRPVVQHASPAAAAPASPPARPSAPPPPAPSPEPTEIDHGF